MFDNQLIALIIQTLIAGEAVAGIANLPIKQAFQPTMQGVNTFPTAYLHKIGDKRYGYPYWADVWDTDSSTFIHTENQKYETTFQISTLATQNPLTPTQYTASDICNLCAAILQSQTSLALLEAQGVGIERVMAMRNPYFLDDKQQNEASPSFDFILTHNQIITSTTPIIESTTINIYEI